MFYHVIKRPITVMISRYSCVINGHNDNNNNNRESSTTGPNWEQYTYNSTILIFKFVFLFSS